MTRPSALVKYETHAGNARLKAARTVSEFLGIPVSISTFSNRAIEASEKWAVDPSAKEPHFIWKDVKQAHREPHRLEMAFWVDGELCGLALGLVKNSCIEIRFLQGNSDLECPLKGWRILVALECATNYAQACGRRQIRLQPINEALAELYERDYGFKRESPAGQEPFFKKEV